jgi:hypothetical protein
MAAVGYYQRHHQALFRFIDDANVPIDNSATEREFQNVAKLRLNVLFAGSTEGAHRACVLLGIVATCRTLGMPVQAYLPCLRAPRHSPRCLRAPRSRRCLLPPPRRPSADTSSRPMNHPASRPSSRRRSCVRAQDQDEGILQLLIIT